MKGTSNPEPVSTRLLKIAELARKAPDMVLLTLSHHIDKAFLREAFKRTRKDGAPGVDGQTAEEYAANLEENLESLLSRFKKGTYRAPPVRRSYVPKSKNRQRPIGIPTLEDKVLQRAVSMVLNAVYEQDFLNSSYGFRPGRSTHQALDALWRGLMSISGGYVIEVDISSYFDKISHSRLRAILDQRVRDGVLRRVIHKWLEPSIGVGTRISEKEVVVTKVGHPFCGMRLPIDLRIARRRDGFVQVVVPDGSRMLMPERWTDLVSPIEKVSGRSARRFSLAGIRFLARLIGEISSQT